MLCDHRRLAWLLGLVLALGSGCEAATTASDAVQPADTAAELSDATTDAVAGTDSADTLAATDALPFDFAEPEDVLTCPGGAGCTCAQNSDCNSGFCVETAEGLRCSVPCTTSCPVGFACRSLGGVEPISYCAPLGLRDCAPCNANADCNGAGAMPAACVSTGNSGSFCATTCTISAECPTGATCASVPGHTGKVCVPDGGLASCTCSAWATAALASTQCLLVDGTEACPGSRSCTAAGLSPCSALANETCYDLGCKDAPDGSPCNDADDCTADSTCKAGACQGGISVCECKTSADCAAKDDANLCNGALFCNLSSNTCQINPTTVVKCPTPANPCEEAVCLPDTGSCTTASLPENSACSDGKSCTAGDYCNAGKCVPGTVTCVCGSDADCAPLEDGNPCNGTLFCNKVSGQCQLNPATAIYCPSGNDTSCSKNVCNKASGQCQMTAVSNGIACNDGNVCSTGDACVDGQCQSGANTCTCTSDADCAQHEDGNLCNGTLFCNLAAGKCQVNPATVVECNPTDNPCTPSVCTPATGKCAPAALQDGSPCDDGDLCTQSEACVGGSCVSGANLCACVLDSDCAAFEDGNLCNGTLYCDKLANRCLVNPASIPSCPSVDNTACEQNLCQPKTGKCQMTLLADGNACDDGNPCTANETCQNNSCKSGLSVCQCNTDADCTAQDDGNLCNGVWYCDKSAAQAVCKFNPGAIVSCPQLDPTDCLTEVCVPLTGACTSTVASDGTVCDDSNPCSELDSCTAGVCDGLPTTACDDQDPCTEDGCDPANGCSNVQGVERCDGLDNDCNGQTDEAGASGCTDYYVDSDQDGELSNTSVGCLCAPPGPSANIPGKDCDDQNENVWSGQPEICNEIDDNCDGQTDPNHSPGCAIWWEDNDADGYGGASDTCVCDGQPPPQQSANQGGDCNDFWHIVRPGAQEICDGQDNDCDEDIDEGFDLCTDNNYCGSCGTVCSLKNAVSQCQACLTPQSPCVVVECLEGHYNVNGLDSDGCEYDCNYSGDEQCDGTDNDCDGETDEGVGAAGCTKYYTDADGDGWGDYKSSALCVCTSPGSGHALLNYDCDDARPEANPDAKEICDVAGDEDCDGQSNETQGCICSAPERAAPGCVACASGYLASAPGQCSAALPIWGAISGAGYATVCESPDSNPDLSFDARTGLIWRAPSSVMGAVTLGAECAKPFGGYSDWRTPTVAELLTVLVPTAASYSLPVCLDPSGMSVAGTPIFSASYWFSIGDPIHFAPLTDLAGAPSFGQAFATADTSQALLVCVRGGNFAKIPAQRYVVEEASGTFTDTLTGLVWERTAHDNVLTAEVEGYCEGVSTGGFVWRLPTALEAATLLDTDNVGGGFADGVLQNWGTQSSEITYGQLWTSTIGMSGARVVAGEDLLDFGDMFDTNGGYQIVCVKAN